MSDAPISSRADAIEPTLIRDFRSRARPDSLDLGIGQPDLSIPDPVADAAESAIASGRAPYTDNLGDPEARRAIAAFHGVEAENVAITCGVQESLAVAILGLVETGDEVLVPEPGFPAYANLVRAAGAEPVAYRLDPDRQFALDPDEVRSRLSERTTAALFNSPSNPTGRIHSKEALAETIALLESHDITWISDEIYRSYRYGDREVSSPADVSTLDDGGVRTTGLSKTMHVMGWRIGWLIGPGDWIRRLKPLHQHLVTCAPTPAQRAVPIALEQFDALFEPTLETFRQRRALALDRIRDFPGVSAVSPDGAFYLLLDVRDHLDDDETTFELGVELLDEQDVVVVPGEGFGASGEGFLRIAYTVDLERLDEAFDRLKEFFESRS
jgi:aspartate/methionine/tyrosine aminotransferase